MPLKYQDYITRADLRANPDHIYVFGDNLARIGYGGQAREMRGEFNAIGIPTKRSPSEYLSDADYEEVVWDWHETFGILTGYLFQSTTVVWPRAGIGTGLADLKNRAPRLWHRLEIFKAGLHLDANHN